MNQKFEAALSLIFQFFSFKNLEKKNFRLKNKEFLIKKALELLKC